MNPRIVPALLFMVFSAMPVLWPGGEAGAVIGGSASVHNMVEIPGYGYGANVCGACHTPHYYSGKRLWADGKETPTDGFRDLGPAKAQSRDQAYGEYPGIYLCLDCHSASSSAPSWSNVTGHVAARVVTHSSREMRFAGYSTKYTGFVVECAVCHDTHMYWGGSFQGGNNGYMIRGSVKTSSSGTRSVVFTTMSGAGSMGANAGSHDSICEVCHTQTLYHKNTNSTQHHDRADCTRCHNHSNGFSPSAPVACGSCHPVAPPALENHSVHMNAAWGPKASCDDCHGAGASTGGHAGHDNGVKNFKDGANLAGTNACNACHGSGAGTAKSDWETHAVRGTTSWCKGCHDGSSTVNTSAGTGGVNVTAGNVNGDGLAYGYDVTGHGRTGISLGCTDCHGAGAAHIDGDPMTYSAPSDNYKAAYRLATSNTVPLLSNYTSTAFALCYGCHIESRLVGMPAGGRPSALHAHSVIGSDDWYTNFRNMSGADGRFAGNWDATVKSGYSHDVPTNIHWNHLDDYGSGPRYGDLGQKVYDSDHDGSADSNATCATCHNVHGPRGPAMTFDDFSLRTHSVTPAYRWIGSEGYVTTRCTIACHSSGEGLGTGGTRWYREPSSLSTVFGVPLGLKALPLP